MNQSAAGGARLAPWHLALKLLSAAAVISLALAAVLFSGQIERWFGSPWLARTVLAAALIAHLIYLCLRSRPRLPQVTAADDHPTCARVYQSVLRVCRRTRVPEPRVSIAVTSEAHMWLVGLRPSSTHLVVTKGLVDQIASDAGLDALVAREVSRIEYFDGLLATGLVGLVDMLRGLVRLLVGSAAVKALEDAKQQGGSEALLRGGLAALCGIVLGVGLLLYLVYAAWQVATLPLISVGLVVAALLLVVAVSRQRELFADHYAAQLVGTEAVVGALVLLTETDPRAGPGLTRQMGIAGDTEGWPPPERVVDFVRSRPGQVPLGDRVTQWFLPSPRLVPRLMPLLAEPAGEAVAVRPLAWLSGRIEQWASWMTPALRDQAARPLNRELSTVGVGLVLGVLAAAFARLVLKDGTWVSGIAVALPVGLVLGSGAAVILQRRGPFLGCDALDTAVTAFGVWLAVSAVISGGLLLPGWLALLAWSWLVALVAIGISIGGYVALAPVAPWPSSIPGSAVPSLAPAAPERPVAVDEAAHAPPADVAGSSIPEEPLPTNDPLDVASPASATPPPAAEDAVARAEPPPEVAKTSPILSDATAAQTTADADELFDFLDATSTGRPTPNEGPTNRPTPPSGG